MPTPNPFDPVQQPQQPVSQPQQRANPFDPPIQQAPNAQAQAQPAVGSQDWLAQGTAHNINWAAGAPSQNFMSVGQTDKGEPIYGDGIPGWGRRTFARLFDPAQHNEGVDYQKQAEIKQQAAQAANQWAKDNPGHDDFKEYVAAYNQTSLLNQDRIKNQGVLPVVTSEVLNATKTVVMDGVLTAIQAGTWAVRKTLSMAQSTEDIANTTSTMPEWKPQTSDNKTVNSLFGLAQNLNPAANSYNILRYSQSRFDKGDVVGGVVAGALSVLGLAGPIGGKVGEALAGAVGYLSDSDREKAIVARDLAGSDMIYTQMWDAQVKSEIQRELDSGQSLSNIQEKYANPWVEFAGGLIDPLIAIHGPDKIASEAALYWKPAIKGFDEVLSALGKVTGDAEATKAIGGLIAHVTDAIGERGAILNDLAKNGHSLLDLTADGKAFVQGRESGNFVRMVVGNYAEHPEEATNVFGQLVKVATGTAEEQNAALAYVMRSKVAKQAFSQAGVNTMALFRNMLSDGAGGFNTGEKFLASLSKVMEEGATNGEKTAALAEHVAGLMHSASSDLFPSVSKLRDAEQLAKAGGVVDEATKALAQQYGELPGYVRALNNTLSRDSAVGKTYATFNKFFAGVYMGLSPAFAMRNALNNTFTVFADAGAMTAGRSFVGQLETGANVFKAQVESMLTGKKFESIYKAGATHQRALDSIVKMLGALPESAMAERTLSTELGSAAGVLAASGGAEHAAKSILMADTITREMDRALRSGALPAIDEMTKAGWSNAEVYRLHDLIRQHYGNTAKAMEQFTKEMAQTGGHIELWRTIQPTEKILGFLSSGVVGMRDHFNELRNGKFNSPEEFSAAKEALYNSIAEAKGMAQDELARVADNSTEAKIIDGVTTGLKGKEGEVVDSGFNHMAATLRQARTEVYDTVGKAIDSIQAATPELQAQKDLANKALRELQTQDFKAGDGVAKHLDGFRDILFNAVNNVKSGKLSLEEATKLIDGAAPVGSTVKFADFASPKLFDQQSKYYRALASESWGTFNKTQAQQAEVILKSVGGDTALLEKAYNTMGEGFRLSDAFVQGKGETEAISSALKGGLTPDQQVQGAVNDLFKQAQDAGWDRPKNALLNAVNNDWLTAHPGEENKFTSLAEAYQATGRKGQLIKDSVSAEGRGVDLKKFNTFTGDATRRMRDNVKVNLDNLTPEDATTKYIKELKDDIFKQADISVKPMLSHDPNTPEKALLKVMNDLTGKSYNTIYEATPRELVETLDHAGIKVNLTRASDQALIGSQLPSALASDTPAWKAGLESVSKYQASYGGTEGLFVKSQKTAEDIAAEAEKFKVNRPIIDGAGQHSVPKGITANLDGFKAELDAYEKKVLDSWGQLGEKGGATQGKAAAWKQYANVVEQRMVDARANAQRIAEEKAKFAMHLYGDKTYLDHATAMVMPYHYWYGRTYTNWMQRMAANPAMVAAYAKYRVAMEQAHAGMPEWYKYNLSTNDLPGIHTDNPLYFNLEATLNPLNGLTGVDFTDPKKRVDWLSRSMDDLGKFGPSTFTPLNWLVAASLHAKGEDDAATRWGGRLFPQTASIKAIMALPHTLGGPALQGPTIGEYGKNNEYDPMVSLFSGGLDPYERNRVGRALGSMIDGQQITQAQAIDAAHAQSGPLWDAAVQAATDQRSGGQVASFFLGVGFKARNPSDIQIDNFYTEYGMLTQARSNIPPDQYRQAMTQLGEKYKFMDTVLISRKATDDSNTAYAYNVIGRIPPGQSGDLYKTVGITNDMVSRFYDDKGTFRNWTPADISRFMSGVSDLGALLAVPDYSTKSEWNDARTQYGKMSKALESQYGSDISNKIDAFFQTPKDGQDTYMALHPEVKAALDTKSGLMSQDPLLYKYYGGLETVNRFYKSQMYAALDKEFGADIQMKWNEYYAKQLISTKDANAYKRQHPELSAWSKRKTAWEDAILRAGARVASYMPDAPQIPVRSDFQPQGATQANLQQVAQTAPVHQWADYQKMLGSDALSRLVLDHWMSGSRLSSAARSQMDYLAPKYGYPDGDAFMQAIGISLYQAQGAQQTGN